MTFWNSNSRWHKNLKRIKKSKFANKFRCSDFKNSIFDSLTFQYLNSTILSIKFLHGSNIISEFFKLSGFIHQKFYSKENSKEVISRTIFNVKSPRKFVRFKSNLRPNFSHFRNHWDFPCRPRNEKRWRRTKIDF